MARVGPGVAGLGRRVEDSEWKRMYSRLCECLFERKTLVTLFVCDSNFGNHNLSECVSLHLYPEV